MTAIAKRGTFFKAEGKLVYGWALVCEERGADGEFAPYVDTQGDHIPEDAMVEAAIDFAKNSRAGLDMHAGAQVGSVPLVYVITRGSDALGIRSDKTGMLIGWEPNDPALLAAIAAGERTGFSIGGEIMESDTGVAKFAKADDGEAPTTTRTFRRFRIHEISLVDRPAMEGALIAFVKRDATNSTPVTATQKVGSMDEEAYKAKIAELEAKLAEMPPAEKAEGDEPAMTHDDAMAMIAQLKSELAEAQTAKAEPVPEELAKAVDVAYTCDDGTVISKSAGDLVVKYARLADQAQRVVKAEQMARELVELRKRAADTIGALVGKTESHVELLRAVESIPDTAKRADALATLKAANDLMVAKATAPGVGGESEPKQADATADYEALVTKRMSDAKEPRAAAVAFVQSTPEFARLYKAMATKSTK